jgi:hypothetical protein
MAINVKETATQIKAMADELGWTIAVRGSILTIQKRIIAGSNDSFCQADMEYYSILGLLPSTSAGSIWGTDGSGIGALSAINSGVFTMNKSGGSKRVLVALSKL